MRSIRLAIGILLVGFASKTCTVAMAQGVEQTFSVSDTVEPAPGQAGYTPPLTAESLEDCHDEFFSPSFNAACPSVYVQVGALFMQQVPRFTRQPIIVDPNTNTTFLSTSDLNSYFNPGLQTTIGMQLPNGRTVEFEYFGLFGGASSAVAVKPDPAAFLTFPDNLVGNVFVDMDRAQVNYSSWLNSFAVNIPCCCGCCESCNQCGCGAVPCRSFTWFGGFRYINLGDRLNITAQRTVGAAVEEGYYNVRTVNNLYGAQFGAKLRRSWGRFGWDASGFAGIFGNAAQQTQSVTDFPNFPIRPSVSSSRGDVAFAGGGSLSGLYSLSNVWNIRAGYNVLWIEGLALAPNQLDFDLAAAEGGTQLRNGGGMFLHGVNVGLEARW